MMKVLKSPRGAIGAVLLAFTILQPILSLIYTPYTTSEFHLDHTFAPPSLKFFFGTDRYGRDLFSRVVVASRFTLAIALFSTLICVPIGTFLGLFSGYRGGMIDEVTMRGVDSLLAIPSILLTLIICGMLGGSFSNLILAISFVFIPRVTRLVRSVALGLRNERFVHAARARGERSLYIVFSEMLPNALPTILVESTYRAAFAVFIGASLNFLGFGVQPPTPEWGLMIKEAMISLDMSLWGLIFPAVMIVAFILGATLLADSLNDHLGIGLRT